MMVALASALAKRADRLHLAVNTLIAEPNKKLNRQVKVFF
jgi:hypothetical protein